MSKYLSIKNLLLVSSITEVVGSILILLNPVLMLNSEMVNTSSFAVLRMFGVAIFILGLCIYQVWKNADNYPNLAKNVFLNLMIYHFLIGMIVNSYLSSKIFVYEGAMYLHWALALLMAVTLILDKK
jgi:hypothetical protein